MLATLLRASAGTIRYGTIDGLDAPSALRARIGVLGHDLFLYPELTARENLAFFAGLYGLSNADAVARAALDRAGLSDRGDDLGLQLLARHAPARRPRAGACSTGRDSCCSTNRSRAWTRRRPSALIARLRHLRESGAIVVLATHDLDFSEGLLDEAVFLRDGRMVQAVSRPDGLRSTYRRVMTGSHQS